MTRDHKFDVGKTALRESWQRQTTELGSTRSLASGALLREAGLAEAMARGMDNVSREAAEPFDVPGKAILVGPHLGSNGGLTPVSWVGQN